MSPLQKVFLTRINALQISLRGGEIKKMHFLKGTQI